MPTDASGLGLTHSRQVSFGASQAISAIFYSHEGGIRKLGVVVHIPVRTEGGKTYYQPLGASIFVSEEQCGEIVHMLGGTYKSQES